jgi:hypothetical protein
MPTPLATALKGAARADVVPIKPTMIVRAVAS